MDERKGREEEVGEIEMEKGCEEFELMVLFYRFVALLCFVRLESVCISYSHVGAMRTICWSKIERSLARWSARVTR
jgi:hypothetical protein